MENGTQVIVNRSMLSRQAGEPRDARGQGFTSGTVVGSRWTRYGIVYRVELDNGEGTYNIHFNGVRRAS